MLLHAILFAAGLAEVLMCIFVPEQIKNLFTHNVYAIPVPHT